MKPTRMTPLLNVLDLEVSVRFYEALGFRVAQEWRGAPGAWCLLTCAELRLMLNQTDRAGSEPRRARPDYSDLVLYLYVDDAEVCLDELRAKGVEGRHVGPQDYGLNEVWLRDPDGYQVVVASDVPGPSSNARS